MPLYQPGDLVRLSTTFTVDGTPTDPTTVTLTVQEPDGTKSDYVYLTHPEVVRDSAGVYRADITVDQAGLWAWSWKGTGTAAGVDDGAFSVAVSNIGGPSLCSIDDVKLARRDFTSGALDELIEALIVRASEAVMDYCGRRPRPLITGDRTFDLARRPYYLEPGEVFIDDLSATPTAAVVLDRDGDIAQTLTVADHLEMLPRNRQSWQPITRVRLRRSAPRPPSGAALRLTGTWGWPQVPGFMVEATVETVVEWLKGSQAVTAPSPEQFEPGAPPTRSLPLKARMLIGGRRRRMGLV